MEEGTPQDDSAGRDESAQSDGVSRRRLVASGAAAWATASLAGCRYITDPGTGDSDDTPTPTISTETTTTDEPVEPTETPDDDDDDDETPGGDTPDGTPTETPTPTATPTPTPGPTTTGCASLSEFAGGMEVGLHVFVYDSETGDALGEESIDSVVLDFPNADYGPLELDWRGKHERYSRDAWGSKVVTDADAESGTYQYEVTVDGEDPEFEATVSDRITIL